MTRGPPLLAKENEARRCIGAEPLLLPLSGLSSESKVQLIISLAPYAVPADLLCLHLSSSCHRATPWTCLVELHFPLIVTAELTNYNP
jgi:hypothetical protein